MPRIPHLLAALACLAACGGTQAPDPAPRGSPWRVPGRTAVVQPTRQHRAFTRLTQVAFADLALPRMLYYGGRVVSNVKAVPVYWRTADPDFRARTDAFYAALVQSEHMDWLDEYATNVTGVSGRAGTNQHIGRGTATAGVVIAPVKTDATISGDDVIAELKRQLDLGTLPANDANTVYQLHFPPDLTIRDSGFISCREYCAFHDSFEHRGQQVLYSVVPDHTSGGCATGCGESSDPFENMCSSASHELIEVVTDPDIGLTRPGECGPAWCDPAEPDHGTFHSEIADICADGPENVTAVRIDGPGGAPLYVQREWSNRHSACIALEKDAFSISLEPSTIRFSGPGTYSFKVKTTVPAAGVLPVKVWMFRLPSGMSLSVAPSPTIPAGGEATISLTVGQVQAPTVTFGVYAESGRAMAMAVGTAAADDFAVIAPAAVALRAGGSVDVPIDTRLASGSAPQTLSIALTGKPPGVTVDSAPTVAAGERATLKVSAAPGTPSVSAASGALTFAVTNGVLTHTVQVPVELSGDDYNATLSASDVTLATGGSASYRINTETVAGSPQRLSFAVRVAPPNMSVTFDPPSVDSGQSTAVTLRSTGGAGGPGASGRVVVTIVGAQRSTDLSVAATVRPAGCASAGGAWLSLLGLLLLAQRRRKPAM